ncbi:hypothetical protein WR25_06091 [Diploscapter pachys]|uniref:Uncharacterized protein n=1 Tax=Diploscapter pachys TaxID=2018661 RepID=A0A2A2K6L1_9BILA|nr:hypothetical protein WR25_06091 [Diploscapter pachys]
MTRECRMTGVSGLGGCDDAIEVGQDDRDAERDGGGADIAVDRLEIRPEIDTGGGEHAVPDQAAGEGPDQEAPQRHAGHARGQRHERAEGGHEAEHEHHAAAALAEEAVELFDILPLHRQPAAVTFDEGAEALVADVAADEIPEVIARGGAGGAPQD